MERKSVVSGGTTKFSLQLDFRLDEVLGLAEPFRRKDETGSGELRIRNPLEIAVSSFVCAPDEWNFRFEV